MEPLLKDSKLFVKGGITVISSLAGEGKTTYCLRIKKELEDNGYQVVYFNTDQADIGTDDWYSHESINSIEQLIATTKEADENDVIFIDSLKSWTSFLSYDVMDNKDMTYLMINLRQIVTATKCSIVLVHHSFKEKKLKNPAEHFFGSRAIEEQCDSGFIFKGDKAIIIKNRLGLRRSVVVDTLPEYMKTKKEQLGIIS